MDKTQKKWSELDLIRLLGEKSSPSPTDGESIEPAIKQGLPLLVKILIGSICGWAGCFVLIALLFGGDVSNIFNWDPTDIKVILFVAFPMGMITGGGLAISLHKNRKNSQLSNKIDTINENKNSIVQQLTKLKELLDAGVISEEEFDQMKAKIINS